MTGLSRTRQEIILRMLVTPLAKLARDAERDEHTRGLPAEYLQRLGLLAAKRCLDGLDYEIARTKTNIDIADFIRDVAVHAMWRELMEQELILAPEDQIRLWVAGRISRIMTEFALQAAGVVNEMSEFFQGIDIPPSEAHDAAMAAAAQCLRALPLVIYWVHGNDRILAFVRQTVWSRVWDFCESLQPV